MRLDLVYACLHLGQIQNCVFNATVHVGQFDGSLVKMSSSTFLKLLRKSKNKNPPHTIVINSGVFTKVQGNLNSFHSGESGV